MAGYCWYFVPPELVEPIQPKQGRIESQRHSDKSNFEAGLILQKLAPFIIAVLLLMPNQAWAVNRIALVIGNGAYPNIGELVNPPNDARLNGHTLKQPGFIESALTITRCKASTSIRDLHRVSYHSVSTTNP